MSLFKQRLRRLLSESFINPKTIEDPIDSIYLASTRKNASSKNIQINFPSSKRPQLRHNKSVTNLKVKGLYTELFTVDKLKYEKNTKRMNSLVRSVTLKDIHNYINTPSLSHSISCINIDEVERKSNKIKKMIEETKENLQKNICKKVYFNPPCRNLNGNLLHLNRKEILKYSPLKYTVTNNKRSYIHYPREINFQYNKPSIPETNNSILNVSRQTVCSPNKKSKYSNIGNYYKTKMMSDNLNRQRVVTSLRGNGLKKKNEYIKIKF